MLRIEDDQTLERLHARGEGFVYNDFAGNGADGHKFNVLHKASCQWLLRSNTRVPKYHFESLEAAESWLRKERGEDGINWKRCGTCQPKTVRKVQEGKKNVIFEVAQVGPDEGNRYVVHMYGSDGGMTVEAWSKERLPYEPRGWLRAFRSELRRALSQMKASTGQVLSGVYASKREGFFDVENVLFYNVGLSYLREAGRHGVRFERAFELPEKRKPVLVGAKHYHLYTLVDGSTNFAHWQPGPRIAKFEFEVGKVSLLRDCSNIWLGMKESGTVQVRAEPTTEHLMLYLAVALPETATAPAVELLKPLIDGVISAFHRHDGQDTAEMAQRLARRIGVSASRLETLLDEEDRAILGSRSLLLPFRAGVQWNPADERCMAVTIQVRSLLAGESVRIRGELREATYLG